MTHKNWDSKNQNIDIENQDVKNQDIKNWDIENLRSDQISEWMSDWRGVTVSQSVTNNSSRDASASMYLCTYC